MFRAFSWSAAIAAFALAVLGRRIRIGAGMTCPDSPLCHGQIVAPLGASVLLEWSQRIAPERTFSAGGAGLACVSFPSWDGYWTGVQAGQLAQMVHRVSAGIFFVLATLAAYGAAFSSSRRVRLATMTGFGCVVLQMCLGIANVARAAFVAALTFATLDGTLPVRITAGVRASKTATSFVTSRF